MTSNTLGGFSRDLLDELENGKPMNSETVAARFVDRFNASAIPTLEELIDLSRRTGLGTVPEGKMDGLAAVVAPLSWHGRLTKLAVVAVPWEYRAALAPQLDRQGRRPDTLSPTAALAAP